MYQLENKPEIIDTIESNYRIARRVYQQLFIDILQLFAEFIKSLNYLEIEDMDNDIRVKGWGITKINEVQNSEELMKLFQNFYHLMGRLPLSNGLLVVPDGDSPLGENKVNMKNLYELFKNTKSHGLISLPFFGLIRYCFDESSDHSLIKNALTELYGNLSYITLSGARDFRFEAVSDLTAKISLLVKRTTLQNKKRKKLSSSTLQKA